MLNVNDPYMPGWPGEACVTRQDDKALAASNALVQDPGEAFPLGIPVEFWDGSTLLLGPGPRHPTLQLHLRDPGFLPSLIRCFRE